MTMVWRCRPTTGVNRAPRFLDVGANFAVFECDNCAIVAKARTGIKHGYLEGPTKKVERVFAVSKVIVVEVVVVVTVIVVFAIVVRERGLSWESFLKGASPIMVTREKDIIDIR